MFDLKFKTEYYDLESNESKELIADYKAFVFN